MLLFATKLYKIEVQLIKDMTLSRPSTLSPQFLTMLTETAESLSPKIQTILSDHERIKQGNGTKRKRGGHGKPAMDKLSKVIPSLIYEMEQFDVQLIKLTSVLTVDKIQVSRLVKRSQVRDFKLKISGGSFQMAQDE